MNTQKTLNRKRKLIVKVILGFIIGISFGFGITKMIKSDTRLTSSIKQSIQENCDCESVNKNISSIGLQFSKDGITNKTVSFVLKNCKYEVSAAEEAKKINEHLKATIPNYETIDIIELSF
ncbi:hypothetical protein [Aequorivita capsosiphonis]|uniref:hypothetical protein n=1 Tax=Aequorivita capsosiphonis TaxID=487317 RepID=UPI0003FEDE64|nr:hypothetical protein [Aequorivita capsosiphonis]